MNKLIYLSLISSLLLGCAGQDTEETPNETSLEQSFEQDLYLDLFDEEEEELDYEAYFFDSKGQRFLEKNSSFSKLDTLIERLIEQAFAQASSRMSNAYGELDVALEVSGGGSYRNDVITASEQYIVSNPLLSLRAQEEEVDQVLGKILKQELDPFFATSDSDFGETAEVSDLVLYILAEEKEDTLNLKVSALSKSGQVLGVAKSDLPLRGQVTQANRYSFVEVPFSESSGGREFQIMRYPVSVNEMFGAGSTSIAVTDVSLEQASNYCYENDLRLSSPYVFEFARRDLQINRPAGNAYEEIIAAVDYEDIDEPFYREEDRLELEDDDMANTFLAFNWNTERYTIVSNSYSSRNMTFRCFKQ
ncbi:hypothetical protein [Marinomonas sp. PE14-40]|uniref:hypothetical protein n=1 Tax=Marinomonas sp. PE14-40 TaxID=3060621 RepID=UPI003F67E8D9